MSLKEFKERLKRATLPDRGATQDFVDWAARQPDWTSVQDQKYETAVKGIITFDYTDLLTPIPVQVTAAANPNGSALIIMQAEGREANWRQTAKPLLRSLTEARGCIFALNGDLCQRGWTQEILTTIHEIGRSHR